MVSAKRQMSRLAAGIAAYDPSPGRGGPTTLSWEDICQALAQVPDKAARALMEVKYAHGAESSHYLVVLKVWQNLKLWSLDEDWKPRDEHVLQKLARAAVTEFIDPCTCPVCKGTKERRQGPKSVQCPRCEGTGRISWSGNVRAELSGLSPSTWRSKGSSWPARYKRALALLYSLELQAVADMELALAEE